jgi:hypothetical protein
MKAPTAACIARAQAMTAPVSAVAALLLAAQIVLNQTSEEYAAMAQNSGLPLNAARLPNMPISLRKAEGSVIQATSKGRLGRQSFGAVLAEIQADMTDVRHLHRPGL